MLGRDVDVGCPQRRLHLDLGDGRKRAEDLEERVDIGLIGREAAGLDAQAAFSGLAHRLGGLLGVTRVVEGDRDAIEARVDDLVELFGG